MPGTFSQLYIQVVFAVKGRQSLIQASWEDELYRYIAGIIRNKNQKLLVINGMPDHIHLLIGMRPSCCLSDLVREIKKASHQFIRDKKFTPYKFEWQEEYAAFSYSHSSLNHVMEYIRKQKQHHQQHTFRQEYETFLKKYEVEFKEEYLFEWIENC